MEPSPACRSQVDLVLASQGTWRRREQPPLELWGRTERPLPTLVQAPPPLPPWSRSSV